jgi:hypothetical protein
MSMRVEDAFRMSFTCSRISNAYLFHRFKGGRGESPKVASLKCGGGNYTDIHREGIEMRADYGKGVPVHPLLRSETHTRLTHVAFTIL